MSPIFSVIASTGMPSDSLMTIRIAVRVPVPRSCVAIFISTAPSEWMVRSQWLSCPRPPQVWMESPKPRLIGPCVLSPRGCQRFFQPISWSAMGSSSRYSLARCVRSRLRRIRSYGSMLSLAARSSSAVIVNAAACGWLGARHARDGPVLVSTEVCWVRRLGISRNTYGIGMAPPPVGPPVLQDRESHATSLPSLSAATLTRA